MLDIAVRNRSTLPTGRRFKVCQFPLKPCRVKGIICWPTDPVPSQQGLSLRLPSGIFTQWCHPSSHQDHASMEALVEAAERRRATCPSNDVQHWFHDVPWENPWTTLCPWEILANIWSFIPLAVFFLADAWILTPSIVSRLEVEYFLTLQWVYR